MPRRKRSIDGDGRNTKKYLTKVQLGQIQWIKRAAKDMERTEPEIVQMAIARLMSQDWTRIKQEWEKAKAKERLDAIEREKDKLEQEANALKFVIMPQRAAEPIAAK